MQRACIYRALYYLHKIPSNIQLLFFRLGGFLSLPLGLSHINCSTLPPFCKYSRFSNHVYIEVFDQLYSTVCHRKFLLSIKSTIRFTEFIDVGKPARALETLYEVFRNKKWAYNWSESILEPIMFKYLDLCVELKKSHIAKEGLFQYRNMFQTVNFFFSLFMSFLFGSSYNNITFRSTLDLWRMLFVVI